MSASEEEESSSLSTVLTVYKNDGNEAFKKKDNIQAFAYYTDGIKAALEAGIVDFSTDTTELPNTQLVATLYANRAAAGLRLQRYEQVLHDTSQVVRLTTMKGNSHLVYAIPSTFATPHTKARLRHAEAALTIGNIASAQYDLTRLLVTFSDKAAGERALQLARGHCYPTRWGTEGLPATPPKRSSSSIDVARVKRVGLKLDEPHLIFMSAVMHRSQLWLFGGRTADFPGTTTAALVQVHPSTGAAVTRIVAPDTKAPSKQRKPAPRCNHTAVLHNSRMIVYGGDLVAGELGNLMTGMTGNPAAKRADEDGRTVWIVDLDAETLRWERVHPKTGPTMCRREHVAVVYNDSMIIHGGCMYGKTSTNTSAPELGDVWLFDLQHYTWKQLAAAPPPRTLGIVPTAPEPRSDHAGWVHGRHLYIFAGKKSTPGDGGLAASMEAQDTSFGDMWRFDLEHRTWEEIAQQGSVPCPRSEMGVACTESGVAYICSGYATNIITTRGRAPQEESYQSTYMNDVFEFSPVNNNWRAVRTADMQGVLGPERAGVAAAWDADAGTLVVAGGYIGFNICKPFTQVLTINPKPCMHCGKTKEEAGGMKQCEACKHAGRAPTYYCSPECQLADWPMHKLCCKGLLP